MAFPELRPLYADSENNLAYKIANSLAIGLGWRGHDSFTSGTHVGEWAILHALADSVVTVVRDTIPEVVTIVAGDRIYGRITEVTVTSGDIELYRAV